MNTARTATAATVLHDGRVLVAGGTFMDRESAASQRTLDTAELWDPGSGSWSRTGRLAETRSGASAVTLADGRVLIVGGIASSDTDPIPQASAEIYDPASGAWSSGGSLATARSGFALVALLDGGALAAGGLGGSATTPFARLSSVERFDPVSSSWSAVDELADPVARATGIRLADGRVLLAGGSVREPEVTNGDATTFTSGLTPDAALFDPRVGTWTATTAMPRARAGASAVLLADGSVVVAGGSASEGNPGDTPSCPEADPRVLRYVPGS
jgi:N-acetylneuraminic acid mutarotase